MLSVEKIKCFYGKMQVLKELTLELREGEAVCVIGPNGAGKTTLMHSICGIMPIKNGRVFFQEKEIQRLNPGAIVRMGISLVPEGRRVFGPLSVKENLMMGSYVRLRQDKKEKIQKDLEDMYRMFPILKEREKQLAGMLSGGEQQMLAISRALMSRPKLLLLDEPSMGLAPLIVREIFNVLERLKQKKTTLLVVEQNARIALQMCDRGYILEQGQLVAQGQSQELLNDEAINRAYLGE
jgi:branched-chain amino acid transport system ATP-binding protein